MNQIKNKIQKDFTIIPNDLIEDNSITDRGRFLFIYMASKPNDWTFFNKQLCKALAYSEDTLRKYMSELENKGWITRYTKMREHGKFTSNIYVINESPKTNVLDKILPNRKISDTENTVSEKNRDGIFPTHTNTNNKQKEIITNNEFNKRAKNKISFKLNPRKK
ncbi:Helix-turn-helix domain-containing protein [Tenacibaculum sp. MAR_2009_124]|uniref:helix-turn-helix domain-containing protein n=1 Tax=Tenacibaculum sp. MAR_2009_124 TaxID=1250059 RepID=UPI00089B3E51|nr:helix-turn-helix domain-containing protein [Tenacibaculum sp. MAR_2009_124]SEB51409.1 Helix-turn-helix domain-containing protein [Tenacibaculum sp. MAR_2009_124]